MGRLIVYTVIAALTLFVLSASFLLQNGGGSSEAVEEVALIDLVTSTEAYRNHRVTTEGLLVHIPEPKEHFVIESEDERVRIVGLSQRLLLNLEGSIVRVTGRFDFEQNTGRFIQVESIVTIP